MKRLWIVIVIAVLIAGGGALYLNFLHGLTDTMIGQAETAYIQVTSDRDQVPESIDQVLDHLERNKMVLCAFINHTLLNEVEDSAKAAKELYRTQEWNRLRLELRMLVEKIDQIKDTEVFDLRNIL